MTTVALKKPSPWILFLLVPFASVSAVLFTPALPELAGAFGISSSRAQLAMTVFLIGYAFGNLPYGPFANRFGRKPAIYLGASIAIAGSLLIVLAGVFQMFWLFLVGRVLSALGSSVGMKVSFTMIGDVYQQREATKQISMAMLSFAIAPGLAIALGGWLTIHFGWQSCFYALIFYSFSLLILSFFLPETAEKLDPGALDLDQVAAAYKKKLKNKKLIYAALIMGCATSIIYLFATLAPFLGIETIGLTPEEYGFYNFIPPLGMIAGSFASHWLATRKEKLPTITIGIAIALFCTLVMLILFALEQINVWSLFLPMPLIYLGLGLVFSNASGLAITHAQDKSNASAMMNFINMMTSVFALFLAQGVASGLLYSMPALFLLFGLVMFLLKKLLDRQFLDH